MPRDLFGDVTRPSITVGTRKWYTVPLSLLSHSVVVAAVAIVPLLATDVLPTPWEQIDDVWIPVAPTPPALPPPPRTIAPTPATNTPSIPIEAPTGFAEERPLPDASFQNTAGDGVIIGTASPELFAPPPLQPPPDKPVRVGFQGVRPPQRIRDAQPVYPTLAQQVRVQGIVIIEATIGVDGRVVNARVLRSVHLLDQAALDAVLQWEYTPTTLNGVPVPVIMTVTVNFTLK